MSEILITPEGYERLKRELEELKTVKRREIVERIKARARWATLARTSTTKTPSDNRRSWRGASKTWRPC
jgi:transcription elongation factor GreA